MSTLICEGCGRAAGAREVYCTACGRSLPGRSVPQAASDAAPPGWLVAAGAHGEGGFFEPLPALPVSLAPAPPKLAPVELGPSDGTGVPLPPVDGGPGWRVRESAAPRAPLPPPLRTPAETGGAVADGGALVVPARRPPLHLLFVPLLAVVLLSSAGAVALLVLHVVLHR